MKIREETLLLIPLKHAICVELLKVLKNLKKIQKHIPVLFYSGFSAPFFHFSLSNLLIMSFGFILRISTPVRAHGLRILTIYTLIFSFCGIEQAPISNLKQHKPYKYLVFWGLYCWDKNDDENKFYFDNWKEFQTKKNYLEKKGKRKITAWS